MAVVLLTTFLSVQFEHFVRKHHSPEKIQQNITQLIDFREKLILALAIEDFDTVSELLEENPKYHQQILIFDDDANEIFGREALILSPMEERFNHRLTSEFRKQGLDLNSAVISDFGDIFFIQIQPTIFYNPLFSPRTAGTVTRLLLLIILTGIVCYWLTKMLTKRINRLQQATQQLANTDDYTAFSGIDWGRDELGQLGNDFQQMANQLATSQQQRQQMLSDISHELRSPLARLQVALAIIHDKFPETEKHINKADKEVVKLNELITQIIHLQKMSLTTDNEHKEPIELINLINTIINDANYEHQSTDKHIVLNTDKASCHVFGNKEQLHSAFENVIRNALSHTKPQTTVEATIYQQKNRVNITVKDYGNGITDNDLNYKEINDIFQPFVRLDSSRNRQTGGYGLGLSIAKAVIEKHNGSISAKNHQAPSGLIIGISLPIKKPATKYLVAGKKEVNMKKSIS